MRKTLIILSMVLLSAVLFYGNADAVVSGQCSNCHTMHNSQNGSPMAQKFDGTEEATPQAALTISTCLGCHNGQATGAPDIFDNATPTAGGSFDNTTFSADAKGHNVTDLSTILTVGLETDNTNDVPGNSAAGDSTIQLGLQELTCAGAKGCHGDHSITTGSMAAIKGFHHGSKTGYRYLQANDGSDTPIAGKGSSDWELASPGDTNHNVYSADGSAGISVLCAQCHGDFHGTTETGGPTSPFTRHPTENAVSDLTATGTVDTVYNPFAFTSADIGTVSTTSITGYTWAKGKVMCLSCHRAHATANDDILRFDYAGQIAGTGTNVPGCLGCHTAQR